MKIKNIFLYILSNGLIIFGLTSLVIKILDWYNPFMDFSGHSDIIQCLLIAFAIITGVFYLFSKKEIDQRYICKRLWNRFLSINE